MKSLITLSILTAVFQFSFAVFAQAPSAGAQAPGWRHHGHRFANLSAEERQKLRAAHQKARQDPSMQAARKKMRQARKEFRQALHTSMLKADPTIQPILDKMPKGPKRDG